MFKCDKERSVNLEVNIPSTMSKAPDKARVLVLTSHCIGDIPQDLQNHDEHSMLRCAIHKILVDDVVSAQMSGCCSNPLHSTALRDMGLH